MTEPWTLTCSAPGCDRILDARRPQSFYQRIDGWERKRSQGGQNHVALRRPLDEYRCVECVEREQHGLSPGQEGLFD